ncbi:MAG: S-methyl-5'-thioinosine phosphorylase [Actinomycetota bacterium]|nr:S-methyl-5'-thioinosine phosphorylase [Actinomycetota bacterium]
MAATGSGALGIIAGTGFYALESLTDPREEIVDTAYGPARVVVGAWHGRPAVFATRHGVDHSVPPHLVNFRAIITALASAGVREILAVNVVGGIGHGPGDLVVVDDFLDFTKGRPSTFIDGTGPVRHVDVSEPYDGRLRGVLTRAASASGQRVTQGGIYACFEGPRFETRAEIGMARAAGATVVGMTGVPEVVLAQEAGIPYASLCLVVNPAAGESDEPVTMAEIERVIAEGRVRVMGVLDEAVRLLAVSDPS